MAKSVKIIWGDFMAAKERRNPNTSSKGNKNKNKKEIRSTNTSGRKRRLSPRARKRRQLRALTAGIILGLCLCLLVFSLYKLISIFMGYAGGTKEYKNLQQYVIAEPVNTESADFEELTEAYNDYVENDYEEPLVQRMSRIDLDSLRSLNPDCIGWIEIPDTNISYPIVQGSDNSYYLTHTFKGEENKSGSIFVEAMNDRDFSDLHTIIYGHNMKNGSMFGKLSDYRKESFYKKHPHIFLDLEDGNHCYQIFSCYEAETTDNVYSIGYAANEKYEAFLNGLTASSLYSTGVDVSISDKVITLSTCTSNSQKRFVVCAKKLY